jgi:hypothetical protein
VGRARGWRRGKGAEEEEARGKLGRVLWVVVFKQVYFIFKSK